MTVSGHSEDATHIRVVELQHDVTGSLGLSIAGGMGSSIGDTAVIIANMNPSGPAAKSQKLRVGITSCTDVCGLLGLGITNWSDMFGLVRLSVMTQEMGSFIGIYVKQLAVKWFDLVKL